MKFLVDEAFFETFMKSLVIDSSYRFSFWGGSKTWARFERCFLPRLCDFPSILLCWSNAVFFWTAHDKKRNPLLCQGNHRRWQQREGYWADGHHIWTGMEGLILLESDLSFNHCWILVSNRLFLHIVYGNALAVQRRLWPFYCQIIGYELPFCNQVGVELPMESPEAEEESHKPHGKTLLHVLGRGYAPARHQQNFSSVLEFEQEYCLMLSLRWAELVIWLSNTKQWLHRGWNNRGRLKVGRSIWCGCRLDSKEPLRCRVHQHWKDPGVYAIWNPQANKDKVAAHIQNILNWFFYVLWLLKKYIQKFNIWLILPNNNF